MSLTSKQQKVIPILIGHDSTEAAARAAGMSKNTLYNWLKQEEFNKAVAKARHELLAKAMNRLVSVTMKAAITLENLLDAESEAVRRATANDVLAHVLKYRELSEIEERLETVERIVMEKKTYRP